MPLARVALFALTLLFADRCERIARWRKVFAALLLGAWSAWLALPIFREARWNFRAPREWDFVCFWRWGRIAALGLNFYDPAETMAIGSSPHPSEEFSRLILQRGFWYPPPTMLLFAPLGLMPLRIALVVWYVTQAAFAMAAVWLLARSFLGERRVVALITTAALMLMLPPTRSTAWFAQTNFMLLCLFVLALRDRDKPRAGVYVALGAIVKPYFLLLLGFFVLKKAYRAIAAAALVLFSAVLMSAALFGVAPLWTFVASNPAARVPGYVYGEPMNQSLVGWLLRRTTGVLEGSLLQQPIYLGIAALLTLTTARIVRRAPSDHGLGLCLMTALLLYPATLAHYSLVILAPLLTLWRDRRNLPFGSAGVIALGAAVVAILGWDRFESHNFWANLSMWGAVALAGHHLSVRAGPLAVVSAPLESDTTRANPRVCPDAQGR